MGHSKTFLCGHRNKLAMWISVAIVKVEGWLGNVARLWCSLILDFIIEDSFG